VLADYDDAAPSSTALVRHDGGAGREALSPGRFPRHSTRAGNDPIRQLTETGLDAEEKAGKSEKPAKGEGKKR
jgi:hypothetical protein